MSTKTHRIQIDKLADLERVFGPRWRALWNHIKDETKSKARKPRGVCLFSDPRPVYLNDNGEMARRFAMNLDTGEITPGLHISGGEWAVHAGSNNDQAVAEFPKNVIVVTVIWHDYYRYLGLEVQAHPDMLQAALAA